MRSARHRGLRKSESALRGETLASASGRAKRDFTGGLAITPDVARPDRPSKLDMACGKKAKLQHYCTAMRAALITSRQRADSSLKKAAVCSGELPTGRAAKHEPVRNIRQSERIGNGGGKLLRNGGVCLRRRDDRVPAGRIEPRIDFGNCRNIRQFRDALFVADSDSAESAAFDLRECIREIIEHEIDIAGQQIGHRRS
jgi:hypothetical protein